MVKNHKKIIEMGFGVFITILMWGSIHPGCWGRAEKRKKDKMKLSLSPKLL
jgi:hypothetical protein